MGPLAQSAKKVEHFFWIFPNVKIPNWRSQRVEYFWYSSWPLKMLGSGCGGLERGQKVQKKNPKFLFLSHGKWIVQNDASVLEIIFGIGGDPPPCIIYDLMDLLDRQINCQIILFGKVGYKESRMTVEWWAIVLLFRATREHAL